MTRPGLRLVLAAILVSVAASAAAQGVPKVARVGMLWSAAFDDPTNAATLQAFRAGLADAGYVEGRNVILEHRHAEGHLERFPALTADLVQVRVDVIVASSPLSIRAARAATTTIPIVMVNGDPGQFANLARPGGNVTGLTAFQAELAGKQMELLKEAVPSLGKVALLRNPTQPVHAAKQRQAETVARALKVDVFVAEAKTPDDFEPAFAAMVKEGAGGVVVFADGMYYANRARIAGLAVRHGLPSAFGSPGAADAGAMINYLPNGADTFRRAANYVARILKGAAAGDLPIEQPTRFDLSLNQNTARALRITLPQSLIVRADRVIE